MRAVALLLALTFLAGCSDEQTPAEQAAETARKNALVEQGNAALPPPEPVIPEPITYPDIEEHDLSGAGCNFAPGTSFATRVIAHPEDAFVKVDGEIMRLAADPGASELPLGARSRYLGRTHELRLQLGGEGEQSGSETVDYEGTVTLLDRHGRLVYQGSGFAQCGS